jgi:hypothetical protein
VTEAKAREEERRTALDKAYKEEADLLQDAQDARQKAKDKDLSNRKPRRAAAF